MRKLRQGSLLFRAWGGRRPGAGRKPTGPKSGLPHRRRPMHDHRHPAHVTVRVVRGLRSLRAPDIFPALRCGIAAASNRSFRVVQFSVQSNHIHLLVEVDGTRALGRGMQGLGIRLAKAINRCLGRVGRVWSERYHCRALRTPREVRRALVYVLLNGRKHEVSGPELDRCSSALWFRGWKWRTPDPPPGRIPVASARTWLMCNGWRRGGLIDRDERPASPGRRRTSSHAG